MCAVYKNIYLQLMEKKENTFANRKKYYEMVGPLTEEFYCMCIL